MYYYFVLYGLGTGTNIMMCADDTKAWRQMKYVLPGLVSSLCTPCSLCRVDTLLECVLSEKDLGITVNGTLNFTEHANSLYSQINSGLVF